VSMLPSICLLSLAAGDPEEVLVDHERSGIQLKRKDMARMAPGEVSRFIKGVLAVLQWRGSLKLTQLQKAGRLYNADCLLLLTQPCRRTPHLRIAVAQRRACQLVHVAAAGARQPAASAGKYNRPWRVRQGHGQQVSRPKSKAVWPVK